MSCEGTIYAQAPAYAPCSGTPCVYYEIDVIQEWSKSVSTENGTKIEKGSDKIQTVKNGTFFHVDDGSGPIGVDPRQGMEVELDKSFEQQQAVAYGDVVFGQFRAQVPRTSGDKYGTAVKVVERIVPMQGGMFVMGQLANRVLTKPSGMTGKLLASRKGRTSLLGKTKRNMQIGLGAGVFCLLPGVGLSIFADPPKLPAASQACNIVDESKPNDPCLGTIRSDLGSDVSFTVSKPGKFEIQAGPPAGKKVPLMAKVSLSDGTGKVVVEDASDEEVALQPGSYTINVKDLVPGAAAHFKGGFSFELLVKRTSVDEPASAASDAFAGTYTIDKEATAELVAEDLTKNDKNKKRLDVVRAQLMTGFKTTDTELKLGADHRFEMKASSMLGKKSVLPTTNTVAGTWRALDEGIALTAQGKDILTCSVVDGSLTCVPANGAGTTLVFAKN